MKNREMELKYKLEKTMAHKVRKCEHSNAEGIYDCQLQILLFVSGWCSSKIYEELLIPRACFLQEPTCAAC